MTPVGTLKRLELQYRVNTAGSDIFSITKMNTNVLHQHRSIETSLESGSEAIQHKDILCVLSPQLSNTQF